MQKFFEVMCV